MGIRGAQPLTFRAKGLSDAIDGSNAFPGAMSVLKDLVPSAITQQQFVPRPASTQLTNFTGFTDPAAGSALLVIGDRAYGMIASDRFPGKDEPFCYDFGTGLFVAISGPTAANCPTTPSTTGDWNPPTMSMIANRIVITHPGFDGVPNFIGWIDVRNFTSTGATGSTHSTTTIDTLSANPLTVLGWQVGDHITGAGIPANTYIVSLAAASVVISQAATATAAGVALTVTSGTTAAPQYGAGNTNTTPLAAVPLAVEQFNGRAYYAVNNGVQFSDALQPLQITNATQALTMGDSEPVTALAGLPLSNQVVGGIVQSLIVFKADDVYYQVTGDQATNNLTSNAVAGSVGTPAPNTLTPTPKGLSYIAPDGLRFIGTDGRCSDPIGSNGAGVNLPFTSAINPSRMCSAYNQSVLRISVQNGAADGQPFQEYWYDMTLLIWTGPHSFPAALISADHGPSNAFVMFAVNIDAKLWHSTTSPSASSTYTENLTAMSFTWQSSLLPDNEAGNNNQVVQGTLALTLPATQALTVLALNEAGAPLATLPLAGSGRTNSIWNSFNWGEAVWGGSIPPFQQYALNWANPLVFKQMAVRITGASTAGFTIGNLRAPYQITGYQGAPG